MSVLTEIKIPKDGVMKEHLGETVYLKSEVDKALFEERSRREEIYCKYRELLERIR